MDLIIDTNKSREIIKKIIPPVFSNIEFDRSIPIKTNSDNS